MKKALFITIIVLGIIALAGYLYLKKRKLADFEPAIKEKLQGLIVKATDSLYRLEFDTLDADIIKSRVTVVNARLIPDTAFAAKLEAQGRRPEDIFSVQLDTLLVAGIDLKDFTSNKRIDLDTLYINNPRIEVFHKKSAPVPKDSVTMENIRQKLAKQLNRLSIKKLFIKDIQLIHHTYAANKPEKKIQLDKVSIALNDILMDSTTVNDDSRFLFAKGAVATLGKMELPTADSLYYIKLDSLSLDAVNNKASVTRFSLKPRYGRVAFGKQVGIQKDRYSIAIQKIKLENINWGYVLTGESLMADNVIVTGGDLKIYCNRGLPSPPSKIGHYPHQELLKNPMPIKINNVLLDGFDMGYEEFNPNSAKVGIITFKNINGTVSNITNNEKAIARNRFMKANVASMFLGSTKVKAAFLFNLATAKQGTFSVDASMGGMNGGQLNDIAEPLGRFSIESGNINSLTAHIEGDNYGATGTVTFLYDNLKIAVLKKDNNDTTQLKKRGLISFIANNFVLKNSNPSKNGAVRTEQSTFKRVASKSFFNLVWKTVEDGIKKTAGYKK